LHTEFARFRDNRFAGERDAVNVKIGRRDQAAGEGLVPATRLVRRWPLLRP